MDVKICGIRSLADLDIAVRAGASRVGFLVGLTHFSEDRLTSEQAQALVDRVPEFVRSFLVTHLVEPEAIVELFGEVGTDALQLHGEMSDEAVFAVREQLSDAYIVRALHVLDDDSVETVVSRLRAVEHVVDAVLLDSRTTERLGGTGQTHDWNISARVVQRSSIPVVLAGGLSPKNVETAVRAVRPDAIDVNSGVENDAGDKDFDRVRDLVSGAARAQLRLDRAGWSLG
ncbi:MAG: phosphoribosylanthranilate isomerase [Acidimicrobiia bacterium]